jgi:hypothetical protein
MAAAAPTFADVTPSDLAGRWVTYVADAKVPCTHPSCRLAYDLVPCGEGWCGIEVKEDKSCGRTAMRLDAGAPTQHGVTFSGRYERTDATQPYVVKALLYPPPRPKTPGDLFLHVQGSTDGQFPLARRFFPLQMMLSRAGDALCRAQPKVS